MTLKLRRLTDTQIVNITPLATNEKKQRLKRAAKSKAGSWGYSPFKTEVSNIWQIQPPMGRSLGLPLPSDSDVFNGIEKLSYHEAQKASCLEVAALTMGWRDANVEDAVSFYFPPLTLGAFGTLKFWEDVVLDVNDRPTLIALDCRRSGGYTKLGLRLAASIMHQQMRVPFPDFNEARLGILQFKQAPKSERIIGLTYDDGFDLPLFSADQLEEMLAETLELWVQAQEEEAASARQANEEPMSDDLFHRRA